MKACKPAEILTFEVRDGSIPIGGIQPQVGALWGHRFSALGHRMLTDTKCRNARKAEKLADAHGLYLFVTTTGFRSWRMKYRFGSKEKRLTFGGYPDVSLEDARELRNAARLLLRAGIDPAIERKQREATVAAESLRLFEPIARA